MLLHKQRPEMFLMGVVDMTTEIYYRNIMMLLRTETRLWSCNALWCGVDAE